MKILYAIQGTGNGHISRARDVLPELQVYGEVHTLISGIQADVKPGFDVTYRLKGMGFIFGKKGNVDLVRTLKECVSKEFLKEIKKLPVKDYDLIINDFEPVSAWASRRSGVPCVSLSHQAAILSKSAPKPEKTDWIGRMVLQQYAPVQASVGFHFKKYDANTFPPVIRQAVRNLEPVKGNWATVYLPAYENERIIKVLSELPAMDWQVFSKHSKKEIQKRNLWIRPIENLAFIESMAGSSAVLCGAGFETPAEAMFLKKKLMVIPMKHQFEQQCNAAALAEMGIQTFKSLKGKHIDRIYSWLEHARCPEIEFPDETAMAVRRAIDLGMQLRNGH